MAENEKYPLTLEGKEELERELYQLVHVRRPELALKLKEAVSMGDLKENADYHDTREQLSMLDGRVQYIENILNNHEIIEKGGNTYVGLGSVVTIREKGSKEDETYTIVGAPEANPMKGLISEKSPIGMALLGRKKKDEIEVSTPNGKITFTIIKIE
jgi:transcription elongation factor GreA